MADEVFNPSADVMLGRTAICCCDAWVASSDGSARFLGGTNGIGRGVSVIHGSSGDRSQRSIHAQRRVNVV